MAAGAKRHEPTSISAEEFQQFQNQLLDLRQANITANDALQRAVARVKQLDAELISADTSALKKTKNNPKTNEYIKRLEAENSELRDKLVTTESSFKLQCSTLRAECHHLSTEMNKLLAKMDDQQTSDEKDSSARSPSVDDGSQTVLVSHHETDVQATVDTEVVLSVSHGSSDNTQAPLDDYYNLLKDGLVVLESRVTLAEADLADAVTLHRQNVAREHQLLTDQVDSLELSLSAAKLVEDDLQSQIKLIKSRSNRMNKELRHQLVRLLRSSHLAAPVEPVANEACVESSNNHTLRSTETNPKSRRRRRENSLTSLSSTTSCWSLSSNPTVASINNSASTGSDAGGNSKHTRDVLQLPTGFFSTSDFKSLVDRMSEVQEGNCLLRRQVQRLQSDLAARNLIDVNNRSASSSTTTPSSSGSKWLQSLWKQTSSSPASPETVNRLKKLCEDLLNENIRLRSLLESEQE